MERVRGSGTEDVEETEIGLNRKKNATEFVSNPKEKVVCSFCLLND